MGHLPPQTPNAGDGGGGGGDDDDAGDDDADILAGMKGDKFGILADLENTAYSSRL